MMYPPPPPPRPPGVLGSNITTDLGGRRRNRLPNLSLRHQRLKQPFYSRGFWLRGRSRCSNRRKKFSTLSGVDFGMVTAATRRSSRSRFTDQPNVRVCMTLPHPAPIHNILYGSFRRHTVQMSAQLTTIISSYESVPDQTKPCRLTHVPKSLKWPTSPVLLRILTDPLQPSGWFSQIVATCRYCSQLVVPTNLGTLVDVNVTCLEGGKASRRPKISGLSPHVIQIPLQAGYCIYQHVLSGQGRSQRSETTSLSRASAKT